MDLALEMPRSSKSQGCNLFHPRNNSGDFLIRERVKEGLDGPSTRCISAERGRALERAMSDARARASVLAKAAGGSLGEALQVNEGGPMPIRPIGVMNIRAASVSEVPVSPGELEIFATVDVAFAIR